MQTGKQHVQCKIFFTAIEQIKNKVTFCGVVLINFNSSFTFT